MVGECQLSIRTNHSLRLCRGLEECTSLKGTAVVVVVVVVVVAAAAAVLVVVLVVGTAVELLDCH